ncbi:MAG TPA: hypothetical protein VKB23_00850 [Solirubrobacterales bacterium]|nr:hypothetical protein [Solirubrobacterales bacterium]
MSRRTPLIVALLAVCVVSFLLIPGAIGKGNVRGVWMAGPGCGGQFEWFQHPRGFPYFCDGNADVEKAHWRNWSNPKATATATFNEAAVGEHDSVLTAPRRRSAVTITASQIKSCGGRHAYTRIVITYRKAVNGVKKLEEASLLPKCTSPGEAGVKHLTEFISPDKKVWCLIHSEAMCSTNPAPPTHAAFLEASGHVRLCSAEEFEYPEGGGPPSNSCFMNWFTKSDPPPTLAAGDRTTLRGFQCTSAADGITCTKNSGAGKGHGFRIDKDEAVEVRR